MTWEMFGRWVFAAIIKYVNIHAAYTYRFSACTLAYARTYIQSCTCPPDGFCIAPDTIAYAKVSGADSIAWRTQLHLTPVSFVCLPLRCWSCVRFRLAISGYKNWINNACDTVFINQDNDMSSYIENKLMLRRACNTDLYLSSRTTFIDGQLYEISANN